MTPSRSKVSPKPTKAFDRKSLTPSKKPTRWIQSGPNVANKQTNSTSKAMLDKMTRKGSGVSPKPTSGPNVVNKLTAGPSTSKMGQKAMIDKLKRKGPSGTPKPGVGMGEKMKAKFDKLKDRIPPYKPGEGGRGIPPIADEGGIYPNDVSGDLTTPMKKGGMCKTKKYARGGGIEVRGKTKGRII